MNRIAVFNGDADGICALHQLCLTNPDNSDMELITGTKRDICLLDRVAGDRDDYVTVLDISLDRNRGDLERILACGATVLYFDHHYAGEKPFVHSRFLGNIDTSPHICTSLLVDRWIGGRHRMWAIAAVFGDDIRREYLDPFLFAELSDEDIDILAMVGRYLNYNAYGEHLNDLWYHPAELYSEVAHYLDPRDFALRSKAFKGLQSGYRQDMARAEHDYIILKQDTVLVFQLPDAPWARRVSGVFANRLSNNNQDRALAVVTPISQDCYSINVRAPKSRPLGAGAFCRKFGGGGREASGGIDHLPQNQLSEFLESFTEHFS